MYKLRIFILLLASVFAGCATINNPGPQQIAGVWENVNLFYSRLEIDADGNGYLIIPGYDGQSEMYLIRDFKSSDNGFTVNLIDVGEGKADPAPLRGTLYEQGSLCLEDVDEGDTEAYCFMKIGDIERARSSALQAIEKLNDLNRIEINGTIEHPSDKR